MLCSVVNTFLDDFMNRLIDRTYFFDEGIFFECQRCGACCTGEPGIIYIDDDDVLRIAQFLDLPASSFIKQYLYPYGNGFSVLEDSTGKCLLYEDRCTVYPVRPGQCSTYPFWFENLRSLKKWRRVAKECAGIGRGTHYSKEHILSIVSSNMDSVIKSRVAGTEAFDGGN